MYVVLLVLLFFSVYAVPALAIFPFLIRQTHTAIAIPVLSSLIIVFLVTLLKAWGLFNQHVVIGITVCLFIMAIFRMKAVNFSGFKIKPAHQLIFFNFLLMLPFFVKLGTHGFDQGDEIYSWNFWGIQHYLNLPPDFEHTGAPYPQFLPKLLAYQYQLMGNIDYQLPIKCLLGLFSFTLLNVFAVAYSHQSSSSKIKYVIIVLWLVFGIGLQHFFNDGYADPIMSASLVMSVYFAWLAYKNTQPHIQNKYWMLSVATALVSAYAKQPGLLWLGFILPLGYILSDYSLRFKHKFKLIIFILLTTGMAFLWMFTEGKQFQQNGGVIGASLQNRDTYTHIKYLAQFYIIEQPMLGVFLILSTIGLIRYIFLTQKTAHKRFVLFIFSLLILPYLILWFTFGAYQLRLGQHVIALLGLLVILSGYRGLFLFNSGFNFFAKKFKNELIHIKTKFIYLGLIFISILGSLIIGYKQEYKVMKNMSWQDGGLRTVQFYFSDVPKAIIDKIYKNQNILLWVPTRYLYGMFYGHTPVTMPTEQNWTIKNLIQDKPNYVITASKEITGALWVDRLDNIIKSCPVAFKQMNMGDNRYRYIIYQIDNQALPHCK